MEKPQEKARKTIKEGVLEKRGTQIFTAIVKTFTQERLSPVGAHVILLYINNEEDLYFIFFPNM